MTTRCHSRSLAVSCFHLLLLIVSLVVPSCHSSNTRCHSLSLDVPLVCPVINDSRKTFNDQKKTFAYALQSNALTKLKNSQENMDPCFNLKTGLHHRHIIAECSDFFWGGKLLAQNSSDYS